MKEGDENFSLADKQKEDAQNELSSGERQADDFVKETEAQHKGLTSPVVWLLSLLRINKLVLYSNF